jgi:cell division protein ZapE
MTTGPVSATGPSLSTLTSQLLAAPTPGELVPPPRFAATTFDTYEIDPAIAGQGEAVATIRAFAERSTGFWRRLVSGKAKRALYLDGDFGVGKTHLLASCFHAATGTRRYLSFAEAMSLMALIGPKAATAHLAADLVCIDEFELDDPTNTRLADLLVGGLIDAGSRIVTTSNTVPGELGQGRMAVDLFRAQLARLSEAFADVHVPGHDRRLRSAAANGDPAGWGASVAPLAAADDAFVLDAHALDRALLRVPVANLRRLATRIRGLTVLGLAPFTDQLSALRFVHLVDRLYDHRSVMRVQSTVRVADLFPPEHCLAAFAKKYRRCQSRLRELCAG